MVTNCRLIYLCAEGLTDGTAAYTHVNAIASELRRRGYTVNILAEKSASYTTASIISRLTRYAHISISALRARRTCKMFYLRAHFALSPIAVILKMSGAKVIVEVNGLVGDMITTHSFLRPFSGIFRFSERLLLSSANCIIAVTGELAEEVKNISKSEQVFTISNGVHTDRFKPQTSAEPGYAIFYGSLAAWHGVPTLLEAVNHPDWPSELNLKIVGEGQFQNEIEATENPLCDYLGSIEHSKMPDLIAKASIGLSPIELPEQRGLKEVSPLKLFEMLAAGVPTVVSDIPGQKELVLTNKIGLTYSVGNAAELANAVKSLWQDKAERDAMSLRSVVAIAPYDWKYIVEKIDKQAIAPLL